MRQCHTRDDLTSILFPIFPRLQLRAFVPNALCFRADCIFCFVYRVRAQKFLTLCKMIKVTKTLFLLWWSNQITLAMGVENLLGKLAMGVQRRRPQHWRFFKMKIVPRHDATTLTPVIQRVNKHYFVTSMIDHKTVNYSQQFVNLATGVHTKTVPYRPAGRRARQPWREENIIQSDVPTSAVVRRWVHMAKKATWCGRHTRLWFFGLLSPSPSRNPEIDNKQTEVRLLMSIMRGEIVNKWTFLRKLRNSGWNRHWNETKHVCYTICRHLVAVRT